MFISAFHPDGMYEIRLWSEAFVVMIISLCVILSALFILAATHPGAKKTIRKYGHQIMIASLMLGFAILFCYFLATNYPSEHRNAYILYNMFTSLWWGVCIAIMEFVFSVRRHSGKMIDWRGYGIASVIGILATYYLYLYMTVP